MTLSSLKITAIRSELKRHILDLNDGSKLDFSESYLEDRSIKRLKHILSYAKTVRVTKVS